jgi:hypothetical protein
MNEESSRRTVGATERGRRVLKWLQEQDIFPQEMDAYRFAIALGLSVGKRTPLVGRQTSFNVGSFDKDESVAALMNAFLQIDPNDVYLAAEEFAETGFGEMAAALESGEFRFQDMFDLAKRKAGAAS